MTSPRITVALSVYDNAAYLAPALDSILAQTFGDFELVAVDDGSTDGSAAIRSLNSRHCAARVVSV